MSDFDKTARFYDRISGFYDLLSDWSEGPARQRGLKLLESKPGDKVLEVGCGTGSALMNLARAAQAGGHVWAVDISNGMLERAKAKLDRKGVTNLVTLVHADAEVLGFEGAFFDSIFISFTLELFSERKAKAVLKELARVLTPEGKLAVVSLSTKGSSPILRKLYVWAHEYFPQFVDCRPIDVVQLLSDNGFEVERQELSSVVGLPTEIVLGRKRFALED